jgi:LacI family transcriptional regulator
MQGRHDLIVSTTHSWPELMVLAEARRQGIACLDAGSRSTEWHIPNIFEDSPQGAELAVRHLVEHGHRRIGFVQLEQPAHWAFDRRRGYLRAMAAAGITLDKRLTLWLDPQAPGGWTAQLEQYLKAGQPGALVFGTSAAVEALAPLVRKGLRIPQDLSLVAIGQDDAVPGWLGGVRPAVVELPLREIGRRAGQMARQLVETGEIPEVTMIPCTLSPGDSVASIA